MKNANLLFKQFRILTIEFGSFVRIQKLFSIVVLASVLGSAFSVAAQTRRSRVNRGTQGMRRPLKVPVVTGEAACKNGWSGVIKYSQTLDDEGRKNTPGKNSEILQEWSHNVAYEGTLVVDGSDPRAATASGEIEFSDVRRQHGVEKTFGQCGAWKPEHWFVIDNKLEQTETGGGRGAARSFYLGVNELAGTYGFSFQFADAPGKYSREEHTKRSGHCQPKNNEPSDRSESNATVIEGEVGRVENQQINRDDSDVLQGSVTIDRNDKTKPNSVKTPITTISWRLRRCSPPLIIADVKFYHLRYPSPNTWEEIEYNDYTIDGNEVKIAATVVNLSGAKKSATVNFKELKENADLPQGQVTAEFEPHETRKVEYVWDTSGYAWKEAAPWNQREPFRQIEVKIPDDRKTEEVEVRPKPVVIVPGMWSKPEAMGKFVKSFNSNPNEPWAVQLAPVYPKQTASANAPVIDKAVRAVQGKENAWHVDIAAHSTGGLMARSYVDGTMPTQYDGRPTATHLVMLGTPNMGTPCASGVDNIITKIFNRNPEAFGELSLENMRAFNEKVKLRHGTKFSILVGNSVAQTCQLDLPGDGITTQRLAIWTIKDWKSSTVAARHENMPGEQANFMQVYKWLAVPPKGNHAPDNAQASVGSLGNENLAHLTNEDFGKFRRYGAMFRPANFAESSIDGDEPEPNFATGLKLAANETKEIEIPVRDGSRLSLILYAAPNVSATLIDDRGETVGKNLTGTPEAAEIFRTITVKKPLNNGKWKLRLENRYSAEAEITITAFIDYSSTVRQ